jgi:hypothetical protein
MDAEVPKLRTVGDPLEGPRLKWEGAVRNLEAIKGKVAEFIESEPHRVTIKFEPEAGCHVARMAIGEEPDPQLGIMVGEFVHNLRSCLDHIAWQVARLSNSAKVCNKNRASIYFPVCHSHKEFLKHPALPFFPEDARALVGSFQPYEGSKGPRAHWLAGLNTLWNRDKHRLVHAALTLADVGKTAFRPAVLSPENDSPVTVEALLYRYRDTGVYDKAEIAYIRFERSEPDVQQVHVASHPPVEILFRAGSIDFDIGSLGNLAAHVADVRTAFQILLQPPVSADAS